MFIGHYGIAYIVKKKASDIPLWLLFTSVQLLDIIAFTLVLLGLEKASYTPSDNPFFRNFLDLPYSHSLSGALLISSIGFNGWSLYWDGICRGTTDLQGTLCAENFHHANS